jgi:hypothetical protein
MTQEIHNILYVSYHLMPMTWSAAVKKLRIIDEATGVLRSLNREGFVAKLGQIQKDFSLEPAPEPKAVTADIIEDIKGLVENQVKYADMCLASRLAQEQRAHIDRAVFRLDV